MSLQIKYTKSSLTLFFYSKIHSTKMNFGTKTKANPFDSKNHPDKTFNNIFRLLTTSISNKKLEEDNNEAQKINDQAMEILDQVLQLVREREDNLKVQDESFRAEMSEINTTLESQMASVLEESMQTAIQNLESWKPLLEKKENFEKMHQNLLQMKKNILPITFLRRRQQ